MSKPNGFDAMGKSVPSKRKEKAYKWLLSLGIQKEDAHSCVSSVSNHLERDRPFEAQHKAMEFVDLTGSYRLLAVLLTG
jgi:hypothetical protein